MVLNKQRYLLRGLSFTSNRQIMRKLGVIQTTILFNLFITKVMKRLFGGYNIQNLFSMK